jgi:hypothetical protein
LPLAVSLEKSSPEVGRPGLAIARKLPHLACFDLLNDLGTPREWKGARQNYKSSALFSLILDRVRNTCPKPEQLTLVLPAYLTPAKVTALSQLVEKAKLPLRGSVALPLALLAVTDPAERRPPMALIVDVDNHALTASLISADMHQVRLLGTTIQAQLNERVWKDRLLNALSDRCVRVCRRDPRDSALAEQILYDQLDESLDRLLQGQRIELTIRSDSWYQNLPQQADDFEGYCATLVKQTVVAVREHVQALSPEPPHAIWLTHAAGRLPGLAMALHQHMAERTGVALLPPEAGAKAAVLLAARWQREELPRTHLDVSILLPEPPRDPRGVPKETKTPTTYRGSIR